MFATGKGNFVAEFSRKLLASCARQKVFDPLLLGKEGEEQTQFNNINSSLFV